jgi:hypothetical protein
VEGATPADTEKVLVHYTVDGRTAASEAALVRVDDPDVIERIRVDRPFGFYLAILPEGAKTSLPRVSMRTDGFDGAPCSTHHPTIRAGNRRTSKDAQTSADSNRVNRLTTAAVHSRSDPSFVPSKARRPRPRRVATSVSTVGLTRP